MTSFVKHFYNRPLTTENSFIRKITSALFYDNNTD